MDSGVRGVGSGDSQVDGGLHMESPAGAEELAGAEEIASPDYITSRYNYTQQRDRTSI